MAKKNAMNMLPHLLGLFTSFFGPLIFYLVSKNDEDKVVVQNSKHALNFQLSIFIYLAIIYFIPVTFQNIYPYGYTSFAITMIIILSTTGLSALILGIIASVKSYQGGVFKYPLEIPFFR